VITINLLHLWCRHVRRQNEIRSLFLNHPSVNWFREGWFKAFTFSAISLSLSRTFSFVIFYYSVWLSFLHTLTWIYDFFCSFLISGYKHDLQWAIRDFFSAIRCRRDIDYVINTGYTTYNFIPPLSTVGCFHRLRFFILRATVCVFARSREHTVCECMNVIMQRKRQSRIQARLRPIFKTELRILHRVLHVSESFSFRDYKISKEFKKESIQETCLIQIF